MQTFDITELFAARQIRTVIRKEENNGVFPQSIRLQAGDGLPDLIVRAQNAVVVIDQMLANLRYIRVLGRDAHVNRFDGLVAK